MPVEPKTMLRSEKIYARLLKLYPKAYRAAYGEPMAQVFRDQCRDALQDPRGWGVARLWLQILPDLLKTSLLEHIDSMKGVKSMSDKIAPVTGSALMPRVVFLRTFIAVFLLVFGFAAVVTFILPEVYSSRTRLRVETDSSATSTSPERDRGSIGYDPAFVQNQFDVIQSEVVLGKAVEVLGLREAWGKKHNPLSSAEAIRVLQNRLELRPIGTTRLVEIRAFSEDPKEAARLANAVAEAYRDYRTAKRLELARKPVEAIEEQYRTQQERIYRLQGELKDLQMSLKLSEAEARLDAPAPSITTEDANRISALSTETETKLNAALTNFYQLRSLSPGELRRVLPRVRQDAILTELLGRLNSAEAELERVKREYGSDHALSGRVQAQVTTLKQKVDDDVNAIMKGYEYEVAALESQIKGLRKKVADARALDLENEKRFRPFYDKKRELQDMSSFAKVLFDKLTTERTNLKFSAHSAIIVDSAVPGTRPVRPNKPLNLVLGLLVGLMVAAVVGLLVKAIFKLLHRKAPSNLPAT